MSWYSQTHSLLPKRWRKKKKRTINYTPTLTIREPTDWVKDPEIVRLGHDELEALRLKQINGLWVISAARQMNISKSLFAKIYNDAVKKATNALIHGRSLQIEIGNDADQEFIQPLI